MRIKAYISRVGVLPEYEESGAVTAILQALVHGFGMSHTLYNDVCAVSSGFDKHLALPLACLTYGTLAFLTRLVRSGVSEELGREYVLAARARGASESRALWSHAFRNALLPLITMLGLILPSLLSGSVIVEQIFAWPGLGRLYFEAVLSRDYPLILGLSFVTALATLAATLVADVLYAAADPRVRYE